MAKAPTDNELLERYRESNDAGAFAELARRYTGVMFSTARRVTGDRHDAEDVTQSCLLELASRAASIRTSVASYMHTTAARRALNLIRDRSLRKTREREVAEERERLAAPSADAMAERSWAELAPEIDAAIEALPEKFRVPVILCYLRGLTPADAAVELGLRKAVVDGRLKVAIRLLRHTLSTASAVVPVGIIVAGLRQASAAPVPSTLTANAGRMAIAGLGRRPGVAATRKAPRRVPSAKLVAIGLTAMVLAGGGIAAFRFAGGAAQPGAYDRVRTAYGAYMPATFGWRAASMARSSMFFWRGGQPLFYAWCKAAQPDWLGDRGDRVVSLASGHLPDAAALPYEVDAANTARLPFQVELLQGVVAFRLRSSARGNPERLDGDRALFEAYRAALLHPAQVVEHGAGDLEGPSRLVDGAGQLRHLVKSRDGKLADLVLPVASTKEIAAALAEAIGNNPRFAARFSGRDARWAARAIASAGTRYKLNSSANQGLPSLSVLVRGTANGGPAVVEFREVVPAAAEIAGLVAADPRSPGRRAAEDSEALSPAGAPTSWCELDGRSMVARIHEAPASASAEIDPTPAAWGRAIASTHRGEAGRLAIAGKMDEALLALLSLRADEFVERLDADFRDFAGDARCQSDVQESEQELARLLSEEYRAARSGETRRTR